jgi:5-methylcytosine-specific restriction protein A
MPGWKDSDRRERLPIDWPELRKFVIDRDKTCRWVIDGGQVCGQPGNQVDHVHRGDDHRAANLQLLCVPHHLAKTSQEGVEAWQARPRLNRPEEIHPALR